MTKDEFEDLYGASQLNIQEILNITFDTTDNRRKTKTTYYNNFKEILTEFIEKYLSDNIWESKADFIVKLKDEIRKVLVKQQSPTGNDELKEFPKCFYCRRPMYSTIGYKSPIGGDVEHILDKSNDKYKYFVFSPFNLALVCKRCNLIKSTKDLLPKHNLPNIELQTIFELQGKIKDKSISTEEKEQLKNKIDKIKDDFITYNTNTNFIDNKIFTSQFQNDFLWIHPYYDDYHGCVDIKEPHENLKGRFIARLYTANSNASRDKQDKANLMIENLKLNTVEGQEETAYDKKIFFLWKQMKGIVTKIDELKSIDKEEKDKLIKSLELSFQILCRNI